MASNYKVYSQILRSPLLLQHLGGADKDDP